MQGGAQGAASSSDAWRYAAANEPACTSYHGRFEGTVDYILLSEEFSVRQLLPTPSRQEPCLLRSLTLTLTLTLALTVRQELMHRRSLPDWTTPSDHVPLACDVEVASAEPWPALSKQKS